MLIQKQYSKLNSLEILERAEKTTLFFIFEEIKETILDFLQAIVRVL